MAMRMRDRIARRMPRQLRVTARAIVQVMLDEGSIAHDRHCGDPSSSDC